MHTQAERILSITTDLGEDAVLLTELTGEESLSRLFHFELDLATEQPIKFEDLLGKKVTAAISTAGDEKRYFNGIISRIMSAAKNQTFFRYRAGLTPEVWLLTRNRQTRMFQHITVPDILKKVLQAFDVDYQLMGTFPEREYCIQYQESDFAFASRLMEEEGIYYFFTHTAKGHKMVLANTPQSHPDIADPSTIIFDETAGGSRDEDRIVGWQKAQEIRPGKFTVWDHSFELPHKHLEAEKTILETVSAGSSQHKLTCGNEKLEVFEHPGRYAHWFDGVNKTGGDQSAQLDKIFQENKRTAEIRMQQEALPGVRIDGTGNCRNFIAGHKFNLQKHETDEGQYVLTTVHHAGHQELSREPGLEGEFSYENRFECIPVALPFRPQRVTAIPRIYGAQTAVVVGPKGEEIFTDKYGRVKVQFHWDRFGKNDPDSSCWMRVSQPWAGKSWGSVSVPRIGQEVIVDFLDGDPDRPIVTGKVYNAEQMPPYKLPAGAVVSGLKSNSTKGGGGYNEMSMDDTKGKEKITVHAQYDMGTTVEHDDTQTVHNNRKIDVDGTHTETIKKDTTITVTEGKEVNTVNKEIEITSQTSHIYMTASTEIKLEVGASKLLMKSDGKIELSGVNIAIDGSQKVRIHSAEITSEADAQHQTKGAIVVSEGSATNTVKGGMVMLNP